MAGHGDSENGGMDITAHRENYDRFMGWAKWGTGVCLVIAFVVILIIQ